MRTSIAGRRLVQEFEGFSATSYTCPAGHSTVGFGHVIKKGERFSRLTYREGEALLARDLEAVEHAIASLVTAPLTQDQFDALSSLVFNIGSGNFARSTLRKRLNEGRYAEAADQFRRWVNVNGEPSRGLARRREAERKLFETR